MHSFLMSDWLTIRGATNTITQGEDAWLDLMEFQDVVFWLDVREVTGTTAPTIAFQTSPTKDDSLFVNMFSSATTLAVGISQLKALLATATVPVARYVRWQITGVVTPFDATFRVLVAANAPGM